MNWLNIYTPVLRSPEFIGSEPVARATWLYVFAYCAEQENGGRIIGAKNWKDRQWQQTCGVTLSEVESSKPLLAWEGEDLVLHSYPNEKEAEVQAKREGGKKGGKASAKARQKAANEASREAQLPSSASSSASTEGEGEGNRKKNRNGKEEEEKPPLTPPKKKTPRAALPPLECESFKRFWTSYPNRKAIANAEKAWVKNGCSEKIESILSAIESLKSSPQWTKEGGEYIPHPATWLNARGWEDEAKVSGVNFRVNGNSRPPGYENWKAMPLATDPIDPPWGTQGYIRKHGHGI
jgi:hypothetical protein